MNRPAPVSGGPPRTPTPKVLLVIPCYNEAGRLAPDRFAEFAAQHGDIAFLFVNDGSADGTRQILEALTARNPDRLLVVTLERNRGKGEAVRRGMLKGMDLKPEYIGYWDADLSTPLEEVPRFVNLYRDHPDKLVLAGARIKMMGRDIQRRAVRHYLGRVFATLASVLLDIPMYDTQCGAKLLRCTPRTRVLFEDPFCSAWLFDLEMILRMRRESREPMDTLIYEVPLNVWRDVGGSKVGYADFARSLLDLVSLRLRYRD